MIHAQLRAFASVSILLISAIYLLNCGGGSPSSDTTGGSSGASVNGVLMWKGDTSEKGLYSNEMTLTPANVNVSQFGRLGSFQTDGLLVAQPLYLANLDMGPHPLDPGPRASPSLYSN